MLGSPKGFEALAKLFEAPRQLAEGHPRYIPVGKRDFIYVGEVAGKAATWAGGSSHDVRKAVAEAVDECDGSETDVVLAVGVQGLISFFARA